MSRSALVLPLFLLALSASAGIAGAQSVPAAIAAPDKTILLKAHAEGAQIYECTGTGSATAWHVREPIASLMDGGKTVGRHFAGPGWELVTGSGITGKVVASAPGATPKDIAWLKLDVASHKGTGLLDGATTVQRIDTKGGVFEGACSPAGALHAEPYSATYVFLK